MVLLTYKRDSSKFDAVPEPEVPEGSQVSSHEGPNTPYIDKLGKFREEDADEEKCDLFFICRDGEVPAHRLVISNASKYIMAMQDDQPPWYPVYISVPDLTREIVQTLVQLAYTGQMNIPSSINSEQLFEAMQALGWVHTDALTASYTDSASSTDDFSTAVSSRTAESLETVLKMSFPVTKKGGTDASDEEDEMEMDLPSIPISDEEEEKASSTSNQRSRRSRRATPAKPKSTTTTSVPSERKVASPKVTRKAVPAASPAKSEVRKRTPRKTVKDEPETTSSPIKSETEESTAPNSSTSSPEAVRSRTRTIRKPKKFDDLIVMTPTKRKESPIKSPTKNAVKPVKQAEPIASENGSESSKKATTNNGLAGSEKSNSRGNSRRSTSSNSDSKEAVRNSLITSYFTTKSPRNSIDSSTSATNAAAGKSDDSEVRINNSNDIKPDEDKETRFPKRGRAGSKTDIASNAAEKPDESAANAGASTLRRRARSNASSKSDKDVHDESNDKADGAIKASKRKRNCQDTVTTSRSSSPVSDSTNPARRNRKPSTLSNSSNKETAGEAAAQTNVENPDLDISPDSPKRKRNRQD